MISIIVPIYKVEEYLCRCVDSLLVQTYGDFELILVDDGSPDGCGGICDSYAAADSRVRVIHKPNGGLSDARNAGMDIAAGEYIAFVDSDDWVAPEYLERLLEGLTVSGADICDCGILRTDGSNTIVPTPSSAPTIYNTEAALAELIQDDEFHQHVWNKLYRRAVIADIRFPKGKLNEDEFFTYQVFGNAARIAKIPDVLYYYFQRPGSIMGTSFNLRRLDALEAKSLRQAYIQTRFPALADMARANLFGSCIYAGQMTLQYLSPQDQQIARRKINSILRADPLPLKICLRSRGGNKLWFSLARLHFWGLCALKNRLGRGLD